MSSVFVRLHGNPGCFIFVENTQKEMPVFVHSVYA